MTNVRELLDAYARREIWGGYDCSAPREEFALEAIAALRAVLDYCDELAETMPIASLELRGRITAALRKESDPV